MAGRNADVRREKVNVTMAKSVVIAFELPSEFSPGSTSWGGRDRCKELVKAAVQAEVSTFLAGYSHLQDEKGHQRLVPRVRDHGANVDGMKIKYCSSLVPPYLSKTKSAEEVLP